MRNSRIDSIPEIIVSFTDKTDKILNPFQRQLLEDTKRVKEQIEQLNRQRGIGSPADLYVRRVEEKFDPDEMDKRDSFYHTTKSLLVLFQIMGVMPIMRAPKGKFQDTFALEKISILHSIRSTKADNVLVEIACFYVGLFYLRLRDNSRFLRRTSSFQEIPLEFR